MSAPVIVWLRPGVGYVADAAASMVRLERALGRPHDCNSSYRDYYTQLSMWLAWQAYVAGTGPYPGHSRALHPDASMHCQGLADDSDDWTTPGYIELAADHGWIRTAADDPTERHHFEYQSWRDNHRNEPAGIDAVLFPDAAKPTPIPAAPWEADQKESDTMFLVFINDEAGQFGGGVIYALTNGEDRWIEFRTQAAANTLAKRFGDAAGLSYDEWPAFRAAAGAAPKA